MIGAGISTQTRKKVSRRDGFRCALCDSTKYLPINLVCLCADCHALAHGINLNDWDATQEDIEQAIVEYLADYYAPDWNPWRKEEP